MKIVISERQRVIQYHERQRMYDVDDDALRSFAEEGGWDMTLWTDDLVVDSILPAYAEEVGWLRGFTASSQTLKDSEVVEDDPVVEIA